LRVGFLRGATIALSMMVVVSGASAVAEPGAGAPSVGRVLLAPAGESVKDSYIVVLKQDKVARSVTGAAAQRLAAGQQGRVGRVYTNALQGFEVSLDEAAARRLAADPVVDYVQQNTTMRLLDTQVNPLNRGLDRIDQPTWPLDLRYTYPTRASDVRVYVIDSGIRATHVDFEGRVGGGVSLRPGWSPTDDCIGHGTHVAGIVGSATFGVAKGVSLVPVRVFDCASETDTATVIAAIDWVTAHHNPGERAIANMSLGGPRNAAIDQAVTRSMADGIVYTVAAGNTATDACGVSPARVPGAVTVGGTAFTGNDLVGAPLNLSNTGPCVDLFAPANLIVSTWNASDTATIEARGTSIAAPFAAGVAAMIWSMHPTQHANLIASDVSRVATHGVIPFYTEGPNRHLFIPEIIVSGLTTYAGLLEEPILDQLAAAGGTAPYTWSATGLPRRVSINPATGLLSGSPFTPGEYTVTITARDAAGRTGTATSTWRLIRPPCPTCTGPLQVHRS
jgi:subtilisin family serine protease